MPVPPPILPAVDFGGAGAEFFCCLAAGLLEKAAAQAPGHSAMLKFDGLAVLLPRLKE